MNKKDRQVEFNSLAQILAKHASYYSSNCLIGKLKVSLFLFYYSRIESKPHYASMAFDIAEYSINKELLMEINRSQTSFLNGISGLGLFCIDMVNEGYIDTDLDEIVKIIDRRIYSVVDLLTKRNERMLLSDLLSYIVYLL